MLQYLTILLDDQSTSFCHYEPNANSSRFISLETLRQGIFFAMKWNLMVQYVYPDCHVPDSIKEELETIDNVKIIPSKSPLVQFADIVVINGMAELKKIVLEQSKVYVLRTSKDDFFRHYRIIMPTVTRVSRLNICITDVHSFTDKDLSKYRQTLRIISKDVITSLQHDVHSQLNILTDCLQLSDMNNCNAGSNCLTLAPDGRFYVCPAFYYEKKCDGNMKYGISSEHPFSVGSLESGLNIGNAHLYKIDSAPLCRICDAYQCRRCVWLNHKMTYEMNIPSRQQCIMAHIERNESRQVLNSVREMLPDFMSDREIPEIDYLDPFDVRQKW